MVAAKNLEVEAVPVERDDARKAAQFENELLYVRLEPAPKAVPRVPRDRDRQTEACDVRPAPFDFVRKAKGFDIEKNILLGLWKKTGCSCHRVFADVNCICLICSGFLYRLNGESSGKKRQAFPAISGPLP